MRLIDIVSIAIGLIGIALAVLTVRRRHPSPRNVSTNTFSIDDELARVHGATSVGGSDKIAVVITAAGDRKIEVIRCVREATGLGLREAKDLVERAPRIVKDGLDKHGAALLMVKLVA
jgi:ribosomal protein L7/L12